MARIMPDLSECEGGVSNAFSSEDCVGGGRIVDDA